LIGLLASGLDIAGVDDRDPAARRILPEYKPQIYVFTTNVTGTVGRQAGR
jgi:hypothetical protein